MKIDSKEGRKKMKQDILTLFKASHKWITTEARSATADWIMIHNLTSSIETTRAWTWVCTFLIDARLILRAISTNHAFWSACRWRTNIIRLTRTNSIIVYNLTLTKWSTRRWYTRVLWSNWLN